jgi:hypothetical protein
VWPPTSQLFIYFRVTLTHLSSLLITHPTALLAAEVPIALVHWSMGWGAEILTKGLLSVDVRVTFLAIVYRIVSWEFEVLIGLAQCQISDRAHLLLWKYIHCENFPKDEGEQERA